ncbi:MAG: glycosyltransferase family 1 protein, partial [Methanobacteriota archaeon]
MSKEFRVLLVTNAYAPRIGGISEYLAELVRGLTSEGIEIEISAMPEKFNQLDE